MEAEEIIINVIRFSIHMRYHNACHFFLFIQPHPLFDKNSNTCCNQQVPSDRKKPVFHCTCSTLPASTVLTLEIPTRFLHRQEQVLRFSSVTVIRSPGTKSPCFGQLDLEMLIQGYLVPSRITRIYDRIIHFLLWTHGPINMDR